ncbi:MAG: hypothetical protein RL681_271 [Candidatus Parcubacteria bacterium]|jgi:RNA polymerase sigma-70 factor (ECF subfamily)
MTDEDLARSVQRGDADAFGTLMERYEAKLARYARRFLFGQSDAEDMVQDAFLKAYMNIQSFDAGRKFSSWLYRIAHNEFITALRKRTRQPIFSFDPDTIFPHPLSSETADRDANIAELRALMDRGLGALHPKYREPLILYYFEEKDYREIADILEIPVATVGVRLNRGRAMLKARIHDHGYSHD